MISLQSVCFLEIFVCLAVGSPIFYSLSPCFLFLHLDRRIGFFVGRPYALYFFHLFSFPHEQRVSTRFVYFRLINVAFCSEYMYKFIVFLINNFNDLSGPFHFYAGQIGSCWSAVVISLGDGQGPARKLILIRWLVLIGKKAEG